MKFLNFKINAASNFIFQILFLSHVLIGVLTRQDHYVGRFDENKAFRDL